MSTSAKVILDSYSPYNERLTTMEVTMHRFVLAEFNTHRVFSRNSASSRAIPVEKQLRRIQENPAFPLVWAAEQPGMQGGDQLVADELEAAQELFRMVGYHTTHAIETYLKAFPDKETRLHKSLINRLLEPFMWHTVIVSSTEWDNFFRQRCSPLAQPEIQMAARLMNKAYVESTPTYIDFGDWHTPYIQEDEYAHFTDEERKRVSVARCARVSYLTHDGERDYRRDLELFDQLVGANPPHASPLEHVATPTRYSQSAGNFSGWEQLRHSILGI